MLHKVCLLYTSVRIVGDDVEPKVYPIFQALKLAEEKELDLVEISPNA